jgi:DnaJ-domain-containing protein 1
LTATPAALQQAASAREAGVIYLFLAGAVLAYLTWPRRPATPKPAQGMSLEEARAILDVSAAAGAAEIRTAYTRLMRDAHPDLGGASEQAARLNAARDRLRAG